MSLLIFVLVEFCTKSAQQKPISAADLPARVSGAAASACEWFGGAWFAPSRQFLRQTFPDPTFSPILPLDQIHEGMRGTALTVFQGVKPEAMEVEVLGVMHNVNGPKGDIILVRLHGTKPEYTGVVAGMSGSPVYFEGKLAGALAFRIGEFSKEPIAGVTPIEEMLEINAMDRRPAGGTVRANRGAPEADERRVRLRVPARMSRLRKITATI